MRRVRPVSAITMLLGAAMLTGCKDSASTPSGSAGAGGATYAKKLVGTWEGTEDFGGKSESITLEFKSDGGMAMTMGPFKLKGTHKITKEDGKTLLLDTEMTMEGFDDPKNAPKADKKSLKVVFDDDDNITVSKTEGKAEDKKFKRKK